MDEQKKTPDGPKPEKKLSRTTLTFYIIGLFTVALALILISYIAQARADRQLDTLTNQLTEQREYDALVEKYGAERLLGRAAENSFGSDINKLFEAVQKQIEDLTTEE